MLSSCWLTSPFSGCFNSAIKGGVGNGPENADGVSAPRAVRMTQQPTGVDKIFANGSAGGHPPAGIPSKNNRLTSQIVTTVAPKASKQEEHITSSAQKGKSENETQKEPQTPPMDTNLNEDNQFLKRNYKSEYRKKFRPFSQYQYVDGKFHKSKVDGDSGNEWYKEVLELRRQAGQYRARHDMGAVWKTVQCRGWGVETASDRMTEIYNKQAELWEQVSRRSSLQALSLAAATPSRPMSKAEKEFENSRRSSPIKYVKDRPSTAPSKPKPIPVHRSAADKVDGKSSKDATPRTGGNRSISVGPENRSPKRAPRPPPSTHSNVSASKPERRPRPTSLSTSSRRKGVDSVIPSHEAKKPSKKTHDIFSSPKKSADKNKAEKRQIIEDLAKKEDGKDILKDVLKESAVRKSTPEPRFDPEKYEPVVKTPPEPTRVRSPDQVNVKSPDPVNWTVPLDTGKTFTVTHNIPEGETSRGTPSSEHRNLAEPRARQTPEPTKIYQGSLAGTPITTAGTGSTAPSSGSVSATSTSSHLPSKTEAVSAVKPLSSGSNFSSTIEENKGNSDNNFIKDLAIDLDNSSKTYNKDTALPSQNIIANQEASVPASMVSGSLAFDSSSLSSSDLHSGIFSVSGSLENEVAYSNKNELHDDVCMVVKDERVECEYYEEKGKFSILSTSTNESIETDTSVNAITHSDYLGGVKDHNDDDNSETEFPSLSTGLSVSIDSDDEIINHNYNKINVDINGLSVLETTQEFAMDNVLNKYEGSFKDDASNNSDDSLVIVSDSIKEPFNTKDTESEYQLSNTIFTSSNVTLDDNQEGITTNLNVSTEFLDDFKNQDDDCKSQEILDYGNDNLPSKEFITSDNKAVFYDQPENTASDNDGNEFFENNVSASVGNNNEYAASSLENVSVISVAGSVLNDFKDNLDLEIESNVNGEILNPDETDNIEYGEPNYDNTNIHEEVAQIISNKSDNILNSEVNQFMVVETEKNQTLDLSSEHYLYEEMSSHFDTQTTTELKSTTNDHILIKESIQEFHESKIMEEFEGEMCIEHQSFATISNDEHNLDNYEYFDSNKNTDESNVPDSMHHNKDIHSGDTSSDDGKQIDIDFDIGKKASSVEDESSNLINSKPLDSNTESLEKTEFDYRETESYINSDFDLFNEVVGKQNISAVCNYDDSIKLDKLENSDNEDIVPGSMQQIIAMHSERTRSDDEKQSDICSDIGDKDSTVEGESVNFNKSLDSNITILEKTEFEYRETESYINNDLDLYNEVDGNQNLFADCNNGDSVKLDKLESSYNEDIVLGLMQNNSDINSEDTSSDDGKQKDLDSDIGEKHSAVEGESVSLNNSIDSNAENFEKKDFENRETELYINNDADSYNEVNGMQNISSGCNHDDFVKLDKLDYNSENSSFEYNDIPSQSLHYINSDAAEEKKFDADVSNEDGLMNYTEKLATEQDELDGKENLSINHEDSINERIYSDEEILAECKTLDGEEQIIYNQEKYINVSEEKQKYIPENDNQSMYSTEFTPEEITSNGELKVDSFVKDSADYVFKIEEANSYSDAPSLKDDISDEEQVSFVLKSDVEVIVPEVKADMKNNLEQLFTYEIVDGNEDTIQSKFSFANENVYDKEHHSNFTDGQLVDSFHKEEQNEYLDETPLIDNKYSKEDFSLLKENEKLNIDIVTNLHHDVNVDNVALDNFIADDSNVDTLPDLAGSDNENSENNDLDNYKIESSFDYLEKNECLKIENESSNETNQTNSDEYQLSFSVNEVNSDISELELKKEYVDNVLNSINTNENKEKTMELSGLSKDQHLESIENEKFNISVQNETNIDEIVQEDDLIKEQRDTNDSSAEELPDKNEILLKSTEIICAEEIENDSTLSSNRNLEVRSEIKKELNGDMYEENLGDLDSIGENVYKTLHANNELAHTVDSLCLDKQISELPRESDDLQVIIADSAESHKTNLDCEQEIKSSYSENSYDGELDSCEVDNFDSNSKIFMGDRYHNTDLFNDQFETPSCNMTQLQNVTKIVDAENENDKQLHVPNNNDSELQIPDGSQEMNLVVGDNEEQIKSYTDSIYENDHLDSKHFGAIEDINDSNVLPNNFKVDISKNDESLDIIDRTVEITSNSIEGVNEKNNENIEYSIEESNGNRSNYNDAALVDTGSICLEESNNELTGNSEYDPKYCDMNDQIIEHTGFNRIEDNSKLVSMNELCNKFYFNDNIMPEKNIDIKEETKEMEQHSYCSSDEDAEPSNVNGNMDVHPPNILEVSGHDGENEVSYVNLPFDVRLDPETKKEIIVNELSLSDVEESSRINPNTISEFSKMNGLGNETHNSDEKEHLETSYSTTLKHIESLNGILSNSEEYGDFQITQESYNNVHDSNFIADDISNLSVKTEVDTSLVVEYEYSSDIDIKTYEDELDGINMSQSLENSHLNANNYTNVDVDNQLLSTETGEVIASIDSDEHMKNVGLSVSSDVKSSNSESDVEGNILDSYIVNNSHLNVESISNYYEVDGQNNENDVSQVHQHKQNLLRVARDSNSDECSQSSDVKLYEENQHFYSDSEEKSAHLNANGEGNLPNSFEHSVNISGNGNVDSFHAHERDSFENHSDLQYNSKIHDNIYSKVELNGTNANN